MPAAGAKSQLGIEKRAADGAHVPIPMISQILTTVIILVSNVMKTTTKSYSSAVVSLRAVRRLAGGLMDLVFPSRCACCSAWGVPTPLCEDCAQRMATLRRTECCPICAGNTGPHEASWDGCGACRGLRLRISGTSRIGAYTDNTRSLVRQYKYRERQNVGPLLIDWLADSVSAAPWAARLDVVTYVPTHWRRLVQGRFHIARTLAEGLARRLELPCAGLLRRTRSGPRQVGLSYAQRMMNVRGAFSIIPGTVVEGARILVVDDVRTTGATLEECARALRRARAAEVYAAVIARARGADDDLDAP